MKNTILFSMELYKTGNPTDKRFPSATVNILEDDRVSRARGVQYVKDEIVKIMFLRISR